MPRDIDHLVRTHEIAQARRNAGEKVWDHTVDLSAFWGDESLPFEDRRDQTVTALRASTWVKKLDESDDLHLTIEELADTDTEDYFNLVWEAIYDAADIDRAWIKTF